MTAGLATDPLSARPGALSEGDLAEVMGAFNEVTAKLQGAHEALRAEVSRLREQLREANERLERGRRLAALGEMAAGIAHEVRNPLGSIRLYARLLEQDLMDREPQRRVAEKISGAVRGLDAVVTDVLAFAREMRVRPERVIAADLVDRAIEEALADDGGAGAGPRRVEVEREGLDLELVGDGALLHRALVNVVRNAVQAMREDESCPRPVLRVSVRRDARACSIRVEDNGPGIPAGVIERIFNPFFTTRAAGTGLGLAIVHRIMDAHAGRVIVSSREGAEPERGTVVELVLPIHGAEPEVTMDRQSLRDERTAGVAS